MSDEFKFCYHCGANLPDGSAFCPECGAKLDVESMPAANISRPAPTTSGKNPLSPFPILILIYGILAIIGGLVSLLFAISIDSLLETLDEMVKAGQIDQAAYDELYNAINSFFVSPQVAFSWMGCILLASGILATLAGVKSSDLKEWKISVSCCAAAAALPLLLLPFDILNAILLPLVGFLMTYMLYKNKDKFNS